MDFLSCTPTVFIIENRYEILLNSFEKGIFAIEVANRLFYEENNGALSSQKTFAKISVPQVLLNENCYYTVIFRKTVKRQAYFSQLEQPLYKRFEFKPLTKKDGINIYNISDVHYRFDLAQKTCSFFGDNTDLLIVNGDLCAFEKPSNYFNVSKFLGDISNGKIPVIMSRGNHDVRGERAENYTDYFPAVGKNTYYYFDLPHLCGIVCDCGEDKADGNEEYGGTNAFHTFRINESKYLSALPRAQKPCFAISHICPVKATESEGNHFDIERDIYSKWSHHLTRIGVKFMLCGHFHDTYILSPNDKRSVLPHEFPVIFATKTLKTDLIGTALTLNGNILTVKFTNSNHETLSTALLDLEKGEIIE